MIILRIPAALRGATSRHLLCSYVRYLLRPSLDVLRLAPLFAFGDRLFVGLELEILRIIPFTTGTSATDSSAMAQSLMKKLRLVTYLCSQPSFWAYASLGLFKIAPSLALDMFSLARLTLLQLL